MTDQGQASIVELDLDDSLWDRFFTVSALVIVGTRDEDGGDDLAPKHMAIPMSWGNHYGFVCSPNHRTYQNIVREKQFAVTYPKPSQTILTGLAASPRADDGSKTIIDAIPVFPARRVDAPLVQEGYLFLECEMLQTVDNLGDNSLIIGRVVAASVDAGAIRSYARDDEDLIRSAPLLAYLFPGRFAEISESRKLQFPADFKR